MNKLRMISMSVLLSILVSGCSWRLQEIRSKTKFGPEYRHSGTKRTDKIRWSAQQGFEFKWDNGWKTGITYRRRDDENGDGNNDNGIWLDFSFPIWKAKKKPDATARRIEELERRLAQLESEQMEESRERVAKRPVEVLNSGTN